MTMPDDLPWMIEYRLGAADDPRPVVVTALPRRVVEFVGSSGKTDAAIVCPRIPYGATGWRLPNEAVWKQLTSIPAAWKPFLNRARPSPLDPRSPIGVDDVDDET